MKTKQDSHALRWIWRVSGKGLWWPCLLMVIRLLQGYTSIKYAYALGEVIDCAVAGISAVFYRQLLDFILLVVINLALQAAGRFAAEKSKAVLEKKFRLHTFSQLLRRDFAQVAKTHTGEWMNRITSDTQVVSNAVATIVPELAGTLARMLGAFVSLLQIAPQIALILFPCGLVMAVFSYFIRKRMKLYHKNMRQADGRARSFMQERLSSLLVVRTFTQESATEALANAHLSAFHDARMRKFRFVNLSFTCFSVAVNGAQVLGIGLCGWGILNGIMSYGTMSSILYLINLLEAPLASASGYLSQYYSMLASAERLMEIEEYAPDTTRKPETQQRVQQYYAEEFASLGLKNAFFSYSDDQESIVLNDFSLEIPKGAFISFTGESGCGKSTTLKILLNLFPLNGGDLYLRDRNGNQLPLDAGWRGLFAYVPQGNQLICGTIRETLTFGDPAKMIRDEDIWDALRIACADAFVSELPDKLDTLLGERGSGLSEGQMQRLSMARAILSGRPILLLDEATSALDIATEAQLLQNLRSMTDRTVLIVTHREAVLDICDQNIHFEQQV